MDSRLNRAAPAVAIAWSVLSLAAVVASLAVMTVDRAATAEAGRANMASLWPFWVASGAAWAGLTALWGILARGHAPTSPRAAAVIVLAVAAAARIGVLALHAPSLSDDVYRYAVDGRNTVAGVNPYLITPQEMLAAGPESPAERALLERVNNPELHTIYLPVSEYAFAAGEALAPGEWSDPDVPALRLRVVFTLLELAAVGVILVALARTGRSPWWAALYAWHPLALSEIAGSGHQDPIGLLLLVAALAAAGAGAGKGLAWIARWTVPLAAAALVKPIVIPVAAFCLRGRRPADWLASAGIGAAVCLVLAAPLWLVARAEPLDNFLQTADRFRLKWAHFGSVYEPVLWTFERLAPGWTNDDQEIAARWICLAALAVVTFVLWRRCADRWAAARGLFLAMVLLSPVAHPWYLLWALILVPMAPGPAIWIASLTIPWGYASLGDTATWSVSPWLMAAAYAPVYGAVAWHAFRRPAISPG